MTRAGAVVPMLGALLAAAALVASPPESTGVADGPRLSLVRDGSPVEMPSDTRSRLTRQAVAYFETCLTYEAVVGERPARDDLRRTWAEQERGTHAAVHLPPGDYGRHAFEEPTTLLIGFSSDGGAWPVLTRSADEDFAMYSKCGGLDGLLLACDVRDVVPSAAAPTDCDRLRDIRSEASGEPSDG